ncbi:cytochrome-c peroxidase [Lacihabitans sp. LS3-19]|uniref:cytochrome-c peroxidase n=1 Tax=Lacihabitans sp. LS3-19 TaxID=2487335 RepID=UPI0020CC303F|nr:cytochrome c peroxidase [Lacihabitans sp. LS3-19]MCP9770657.1 cytochrome-c peroxidase [Lacihabitans sp. LS3-19]
MKKRIGIVLGLTLGLWSCSEKIETEPEAVEKPLFEIPSTFPTPTYNMASNPITEDGFVLGKKIFFDGKLSRDGTISCAECHNQVYAFTHHGHAISHGLDGLVGIRNAPTLVNLAWQNTFFWDGGVFDLDLFSLAPIENHVEMDEKIGNVLDKLRNDKDYPGLFKKAFGTEDITTERFLKSLSQFMLTLISANSRYDKYIAGKEPFTSEETEGLRLFKEKGCVTCHPEPLFTDHSFKSNGLPTDFYRNFIDYGRFRITELDVDKNKFKVPSLRNIEYTFPYMHDGRFNGLDEVLDHYSDGMADLENLDPIFKKTTKIGVALTAKEKSQIIAFLKTLTDEGFLKDKRFAAP